MEGKGAGEAGEVVGELTGDCLEGAGGEGLGFGGGGLGVGVK